MRARVVCFMRCGLRGDGRGASRRARDKTDELEEAAGSWSSAGLLVECGGENGREKWRSDSGGRGGPTPAAEDAQENQRGVQVPRVKESQLLVPMPLQRVFGALPRAAVRADGLLDGIWGHGGVKVWPM